MLLKVVENTNLTPQCEADTAYFMVLASQTALTYQTGDWLLVKPQNAPGLVENIKSLLNLHGDERVELRRVGEVSVDEALLHHLELSQLNPAILNKLQRHFGWQHWADRQQMIDFAWGKDIVDLLTMFKEAAALGLACLDFLLPLAPRYYSVASYRESPLAGYANAVAILYKPLRYETLGRAHFGVASNWLAQQPLGAEVAVEFVANAAFKLPSQPSVPIIMVGAGTGLAPFLGFMAQRVAQGATDNTLFFGETHQASHFLKGEQLTAYEQAGCLKLYTAFSRDGEQKIYVQNRLWQARDWVWRCLQQSAHIYICGDKKRMATAVAETFMQILTDKGATDAPAIWQAWRAEGRVQLDVF